MARMRERQTSFAGGDFSPGLWGRTDLQKYASGCRRVRDFFVSPFGTLVSRPGTQHVDRLPELYPSETRNVRLVPFVFSDTDALILFIAPQALAVYKYDSTVGRAVRLEITLNVLQADLPWTSTMIPSLRFAQMGDVVTIVGPGLQPLELRRLTADCTQWELVQADFNAPAFPGHGGIPALMREQPAVGTFEPPGGVADETHPARVWQWAVSRVMQTAGGTTYETSAYVVNSAIERRVAEHVPNAIYVGDSYVYIESDDDNWYRAPTGTSGVNPPSSPWVAVAGEDWNPDTVSSAPDEVSCYADRPVTVDWTVWPQRPEDVPDDADEVLATNIYRGCNGRFGWVGTVWAADGEQFIDDGAEPDYSRPPRSGRIPFVTRSPSGAITGTDYPTIVGFFDGRQVFAATEHRPDTVFASATESFHNFDAVIPAKESDSLSFVIATGKFEQVRAIVPRQSLLVLTDSSEWIVGGAGQNQLLSPNSIAARPLSEYGSAANPPPLSFHDLVVFLQRKGTIPRALVRGEYGDLATARAIDLSTFSRHLFVGHSLLDWCYAEDPWSLLWAVRDDGSLLSCALDLGQQLVAWTRHQLAGGGVVRAVASIPEGYEDAVYLIVQRGQHDYLERFATRVHTDVREAVCLDASVTHDGRNTDSTKAITVTSIGGARDPLDTVGVALTETVQGTYDGKRVRVHASGGATFDVTLGAATALSTYPGVLEDPLPEAADGVATETWGVCAQGIKTSHLGNDEVWGLLDGDVRGPINADGGVVRFDSWAEVAHVGYLFLPAFESLNVAPERGKQKRVIEAGIETEGARGGRIGFDADLDFDSLTLATVEASALTEVRDRLVADAYGAIPLRASEDEHLVRGAWDRHGRVQFIQTSPLPVTLLGITREVEVGG